LAIIHFAQWGVMSRHRAQVGEPGRLGRSLVFVSVFDGEVDSYIVTLATLIRRRFYQTFGFCVGVPRPRPAGGLLQYIARHQHRCPFFYAAYPEATMCEVRAALWLSEQLTQLAADDRATPDERQDRLRQIERRRAGDARRAYRTGPLALTVLAARKGFRSTSFTTLAPITKGRETEMVERLVHLQEQGAAAATFASIDGTHYARFSMIDPVHDEHDEPMYYASAFLLFSVQFDTGPALGAHPAAWYAGELFARLHDWPFDPWSACLGYPRPPDRRLFTDYLRVGAVPTGLFLPGTLAPAPAIRRALALDAAFETTCRPLLHAGDAQRLDEALRRVVGSAR
jgi:hypothetical protein